MKIIKNLLADSVGFYKGSIRSKIGIGGTIRSRIINNSTHSHYSGPSSSWSMQCFVSSNVRSFRQ